jgi:hypothetical protein
VTICSILSISSCFLFRPFCLFGFFFFFLTWFNSCAHVVRRYFGSVHHQLLGRCYKLHQTLGGPTPLSECFPSFVTEFVNFCFSNNHFFLYNANNSFKN